MPKDDYFAIVYKILEYLYSCMRSGEPIVVENINWVSIPPTENFSAQVKIRAQHKPADAEIIVKDNIAKVIFGEQPNNRR